MILATSSASGALNALAGAFRSALHKAHTELTMLQSGRSESPLPALLQKLQDAAFFAGMWGVANYLIALRELTEQLLRLNASKDANREDRAERAKLLSTAYATLTGYLRDLSNGSAVSYLELNQAFAKIIMRARPDLLQVDTKEVAQLLYMAAPPTLELDLDWSPSADASHTGLLTALAAEAVSDDQDEAWCRDLARFNPYASLKGFFEAICAIQENAGAFGPERLSELRAAIKSDLVRLQDELVDGVPLNPPVPDPFGFSTLMANLADVDEPGPIGEGIKTKYGLIKSDRAGAVNEKAKRFLEAVDRASKALKQATRTNTPKAFHRVSTELAEAAPKLPSPAFQHLAARMHQVTAQWLERAPSEPEWVFVAALLEVMQETVAKWGREGAQRYLNDYAQRIAGQASLEVSPCAVVQESVQQVAITTVLKVVTRELDALASAIAKPLDELDKSSDPAQDATIVLRAVGESCAARAGKAAGIFDLLQLVNAGAASRSLQAGMNDASAWAERAERSRFVMHLTALRVLVGRLRPGSLLDLEPELDLGSDEAPNDALTSHAQNESSADAPMRSDVAADASDLDRPSDEPGQPSGDAELSVRCEAGSVPTHGGDAVRQDSDAVDEVLGSATGAPFPDPALDVPEMLDVLAPGGLLDGFDTNVKIEMHEDGGVEAWFDSDDADENQAETWSPVGLDPEALLKAMNDAAAGEVDELSGSDALINVFFEEAEQCCDAVVASVQALRLAEDGADHEMDLDEIRRRVHTIKGGSRTCGLLATGALLHELETALDDVADAGAAVLPYLGVVEAGLSDVARRLEEAKQGFYSRSVPAAVPSTALIEDQQGEQQSQVAEPLKPPSRTAEKPPVSPESGASVRIPVELATSVGQASGALLAASRDAVERIEKLQRMTSGLKQILAGMRPISDGLRALAQSAGVAGGSSESGRGFDSLELERMSALEELVQQMSEVVDDAVSSAAALGDEMRAAGKRERELAGSAIALQRQSSELLLVPVESHRDRLERVVALAAADTGKRVSLSIDRDAKVPSAVVDKLLPAVEHLLRNAVAHGIEAPEDRLGKGKPEEGTIVLEAPVGSGLASGMVLLSVRDDGAGVNVERVREKAEQKGIIPQGSSMSPDRLRDLIFAPGFSTAAKVTQLAGRGVGLDVVRATLSAIGGKVGVDAPEEGGTAFVLTIPADAASMAVAPVMVAGQRYMIPSVLIQQVVPLAASADIELRWAERKVTFNGQKFNLRDLRDLVGTGPASQMPRRGQLLIMAQAGTPHAVFVDQIEPMQRVVVQPLGPFVRDLPGMVAGTYAASSGLTLIVNPMDLPEVVEQQQGPWIAQATLQRRQTVLVVDDSATVRLAAKGTLAGMDYDVALASDGREAMEQLEGGLRPIVVLTDLEMRGMDGFELLAAIRSSGLGAQLPVVVISSRSSEKHQQRAMELGALAFLKKPFDDWELRRVLAGIEAGRTRRPAAPSGESKAPPYPADESSGREEVNAGARS